MSGSGTGARKRRPAAGRSTARGTQEGPTRKKFGLLPFDDAAGVGPELGGQVAVHIRSELLKAKKLMPKFIARLSR